MSFGAGARNAVAIGVAGLVSLFSGAFGQGGSVGHLLAENDSNLLLESGGVILLE